MSSYVKLSLFAFILVAAGCAASKPPPAMAPADAQSRPAPDYITAPGDEVDMTYTPKDAVAAGHDTPATSVRPKNAAAGKTPRP
jgi:hypothetical protein